MLLQAYQRLHQPRATLVIVGDGPARKALQAQCPEAVFTGFRTGEDLAACYASSDLLLFPSLTETFCNVTTEALANGLPLVAFNDAAAGQLVTHDLNAQCAGRSARPGVTEPMAQEPP